MNTKEFKTYLEAVPLRPGSIRNNLRYTRRFNEWLEETNLTHETCKYNDLLGFVKKYREQGFTTGNLNKHLCGVRYYYQYLKKEGLVTHNPAQNLFIKGEFKLVPRDIVSKEQMEQVYNEYKAETPVQKRNKVCIGLIVYQALTREELDNLEPTDIDLTKGNIMIRRNVKNRRRLLNLEAPQVLSLQEYVTTVRPELLKLKGQDSEKLFITIGESASIKEALRELLNELKPKHPFLKSFIQIRVSRISHWVKEKHMREAQYLAGHGSIHNTQRYKQVNPDDLHVQLDLFHPLK